MGSGEFGAGPRLALYSSSDMSGWSTHAPRKSATAETIRANVIFIRNSYQCHIKGKGRNNQVARDEIRRLLSIFGIASPKSIDLAAIIFPRWTIAAEFE
jgi:hypothetical protein